MQELPHLHLTNFIGTRLAAGRAYYPCRENGTFKWFEEAADGIF